MQIADTVTFPADVVETNGNFNSSAGLSVPSSTTLTAIPGLTANVQAGATYLISIHLNGSANVAGGAKVAFGGTAAASAFNMTTWNYNGTTTNAVTNVTSLASSLTAVTAVYTDIVAEGTLVVSTAGTLILQMAQNASNAAATTIAANGAQMYVSRVS
jgi:hypothetical protein